MKKCPNCGTQWDDAVAFCGKCGTRTEEIPANDESITQPEETTSTEAYTVPVSVDPSPAPANNEPPYNEPENEPESKPKKSKRKLIIAIIVAIVILAAVAVTGYLTDWFGLTPPIKKLFNSIDNTISANSMTLDVKLESGRGEYTSDESANIRYVINPKAEELTIMIDDHYMIIDELFYYKSTGGTSEYAAIDEYDISELFKYYNAFVVNKTFDMDLIGDAIDDADGSDYIDTDKLKPTLEMILEDYLFNEEWLEKTAKFSKDGDTYTFNPNLKKVFKDFRSICKDTDAIIDDELREELIEEIDDIIEEIEEDGLKLKITITVDGGYIKECVIEVEYGSNLYDEPYYDKLTISFSNINETEITNEEIQSFADEVNRRIAENTCATCGDTTWYSEHGSCKECGAHYTSSYYDGYCYDCYYKDCDSCGSNHATYTYRGHNLCYDCYYDSDYDCCDLCCHYGYTYYYKGYDLCWDCYLDY